MAKIGRPTKEPEIVSDTVIHIRLPQPYKETLQDKASAAGMTLSKYLYATGMRQRITPAKKIPGVNLMTYAELKKEGININQIAKRLNESGEHVAPEIMDALRRLEAKIDLVAKELMGG